MGHPNPVDRVAQNRAWRPGVCRIPQQLPKTIFRCRYLLRYSTSEYSNLGKFGSAFVQCGVPPPADRRVGKSLPTGALIAGFIWASLARTTSVRF